MNIEYFEMKQAYGEVTFGWQALPVCNWYADSVEGIAERLSGYEAEAKEEAMRETKEKERVRSEKRERRDRFHSGRIILPVLYCGSEAGDHVC